MYIMMFDERNLGFETVLFKRNDVIFVTKYYSPNETLIYWLLFSPPTRSNLPVVVNKVVVCAVVVALLYSTVVTKNKKNGDKKSISRCLKCDTLKCIWVGFQNNNLRLKKNLPEPDLNNSFPCGL